MGKFMKIILIIMLIALSQISYSQWEVCSNGLEGATLDYDVITSSGDYLYIGGSKGVFFYSSNNGDSWIERSIPNTAGGIRDILVTENYIFAGLDQKVGGIYRTSDRGENWEWVVEGLASIEIFSLLEKDGKIYCTSTYGGVHISTDNGDSWFPSSNGLGSPWSWGLHYDENYMFVTTTAGLYLSQDSGESWYPRNDGLPTTDLCVMTICNGDLYFGTLGKGVYFSSNYGINWSEKNNGLEAMEIWSITNYDNYVFVGTGKFWYGKASGVQFTSDRGESWVKASNGLPNSNNVYATILDLVVKDDYMFASVDNNGIYRVKLSELLLSSISEMDNSFKLINLYPNPTQEIGRAHV